jgi:hypothetical protein
MDLFIFYSIIILIAIFLWIKVDQNANRKLKKLKIEGRINCIKNAIANGNIINYEEAYQKHKSGNGSINFRINEPYSKMLLFYDYPNITKYWEEIDLGEGIERRCTYFKNLRTEKFRQQHPDIDVDKFLSEHTLEDNDFVSIISYTKGNHVITRKLLTWEEEAKDKNIQERYKPAQPKLIVDENNNLLSLEDFQKQYPNVKVVIDRTIWAMST